MSKFVSIEKGIIPKPKHPLVGLRIICSTSNGDELPFQYELPTIRVTFKQNIPYIEHNLRSKEIRLKAGSLGFWLQTPKEITDDFDSFDSILFTEKRWSKPLDFYSIKTLKNNSIIISSTGASKDTYMDGPLIHMDNNHQVKNFIPEGGPGRIIFSGKKQSSSGVDLSKIKDLYADNSQIYKRCFSSMLKTLIKNPIAGVHLSNQCSAELVTLTGLTQLVGIRLNITASYELKPQTRRLLKTLSIDPYSVKIKNAPEGYTLLEHFSVFLNQDELDKLALILNI